MKTKIFLLIGTLLLACCLLLSCRDHGLLSDDFDAGDTVTPEELLEISAEIFARTEPSSKNAKETEEPQTLAPDATVYWLSGGSVYHAKADCRHIVHAAPEDILEGKIPDAEADGKTRLCASCIP